MLLPLSSLKVLAALRSSTRSLPRSQLACWGKLPELFFLAFFQTPQQGISTLLPRPQSQPAFRRRRWKFPALEIWKLHLEMFTWKFLLEKTRKSLSRFWFPAKISARRRGPQDAKPTLAGTPFGLFPAREKPPPSGVRSFPLKIKCCIDLLPLERPRQRESDVT